MANISSKEWTVVILFLVFTVIFVAFFSRSSIKVEGKIVTIKTPQAQTVLEKTAQFESVSYLVVGQGLNKMDYYDTHLPVISMDTVQALTSQYGDFRQCTSPGAEAGKQSTRHIRLVGMTDEVKKKIAAVYWRSRKLKDFTIKVSQAPCVMISHDLRSNRARALMNMPHEDYLVNNIEIIQKVRTH